MKPILAMLAYLILLASLTLAKATPPVPPRLILALDGTGSLQAPSPINPRFSQQQVLFDLVNPLLAAARSSGSSLSLLVICHQPLLVMEGNLRRSSFNEVLKNVGLASKDCTQKGTRIDLTLEAIGELVALDDTPYWLVLLSDGINEDASGLRLEAAYQALQSLPRPPRVFALLGANETLRLRWKLEATRTLKGTQVIISSNRDLLSGKKQLIQALHP